MLNESNIPLEEDGIEEEILVDEEVAITKAMWGDIGGNIENQTDLQNALDAKQDSLTQAQLDAVNSGIDSTKVGTYDGYQAQINTKASQSALDAEAEALRQADSTLQGNIDAEETARKASDKDIQDVLDGETLARQNADIALGGRIDTEIHDRQVADIGLQGQIDAITSKSDVVDVVATYADLQAYDTQHLGDNDVIKVLDDETHGDALTYYRWSKTNQTWTFIGQEAPYYSKSQTDTLLLGKQNTIDSSHKLSADLVDDTSTTNKFVTAQDKTNWNGKQDALTAGTGIDITGGVISTPAIVPEVVTELPTTGAEGKLYLTPKAHTTSTATGNPITVITDYTGHIESFQLDGDTLQDGEPSPENPVAIQTVTGQQTVSINATNYPISLGSLELCKLGTYQDYIWKDGEDWKVHKATAIASASDRAWTWSNVSPNGWYFSRTSYGFHDTNKINVISKSFMGVKRLDAPNTSGAFITMAGDGNIGIRNPNITGSSNLTQFVNWINSLNTTWLYALKTPTDTTITDQTLIAQLEAVLQAKLQASNTITNTATGTNLAGDMEIGYYGFNPTNRYDKFIWLDLNNNYEQIGGE